MDDTSNKYFGKLNIEINNRAIKLNYYNLGFQIYNKIVDLIFRFNPSMNENGINVYITREDNIDTKENLRREYDYRILRNDINLEYQSLNNDLYRELSLQLLKVESPLSMLTILREYDFFPFNLSKIIPPFEIHYVNCPNFDRISDIEKQLNNYRNVITRNNDNIYKIYIPTLDTNEVYFQHGTVDIFKRLLTSEELN
jgi:hypothetical protein